MHFPRQLNQLGYFCYAKACPTPNVTAAHVLLIRKEGSLRHLQKPYLLEIFHPSVKQMLWAACHGSLALNDCAFHKSRAPSFDTRSSSARERAISISWRYLYLMKAKPLGPSPWIEPSVILAHAFLLPREWAEASLHQSHCNSCWASLHYSFITYCPQNQKVGQRGLPCTRCSLRRCSCCFSPTQREL